ncbi:MAG TPA: MAPEG family protein [Patescibacteria group bacterium]|nr:MAPEG family protein [Patescibacteria group bacterium]
MPWVVLVAVLALLQFSAFGALVGRARGQFGVNAPATTGHEVFERYYRVHYNTMEQIVVLLPALFLSANYGFGADWISAALGAVYLVGRQLYLHSYVRDPKSRGLGFGLTILPAAILLLNAGAGAVMSLR